MRCREVQAAPDSRLDLWAREHFKSTIITFALSIQDILIDPEVTIGIFSHTRPIAKGFLRQIKQEFETNKELIALFPDVLYDEPRRQSPKWSEDDGIIVKRQGNPRESTVEAWGVVDGQPTGKHFSRLLYDDLVTKESVTTPDMMRKVTEAWELSLNLGTEDGKRRYVGTRYHFNDTYGSMIRRGAAQPRIYPATKDGTVEGEPVLMRRETLAEKRREMGPYTFGCQMLLDPKADEVQGFDREWVMPWPGKSTERLNVYIVVDPASKKKPGSDYTTMQVIGLGEDKNYYWIAGIRDRMNLTQRGKKLIELHREYRPIKVGYEEYGLQADIEFVQYLQDEQNYRFKIEPLGGKISKPERIRGLIPPMEQGRWYMPPKFAYKTVDGELVDIVQIFMDEELDAFPVSAHDDLLDGCARIIDPKLGAEFPSPAKDVRRANLPSRANSGYSPHRWRG